MHRFCQFVALYNVKTWPVTVFHQRDVFISVAAGFWCNIFLWFLCFLNENSWVWR